MFNDTALIDHLDKEQALEVEAGCFLELNQNDISNIERIGVFKYGTLPNSQFNTWIDDQKYYYRHDVVTSNMKRMLEEEDTVFFGKHPKADYFSLADCFTDFRPRSGIMKAVQPMSKNQVYIDDFTSVRRPRTYVPSVKDSFKYWTSWNTDINPVLNIGLSALDGKISNASPFVVYKEPIAVNQVTVKIQTGQGESRASRTGFDPFIDRSKSTLPRVWRIEYLDIGGTWQTIRSFGEYEPEWLDPISGTLDLVYMIENPWPTEFPNFVLKGFLGTTAHLPYRGRIGEAFIIGRSTKNIGKIVVWDGSKWRGADDIDNGNLSTVPDMRYTWRQLDYKMSPEEYAVRDFVNPRYYDPDNDASAEYDEFVLVRGLRIIVEEMVAGFRPFELIELSPRLFCNMSKYVESYEISKSLSDESPLPVGDMAVSNGSVILSNMDLILNREKKFDWFEKSGSILSGRVKKNSKFIFYEIVKNVSEGGFLWDKFVPVKTLYAMERPSVISGTESVEIQLRDLTFLFEENLCQSIVLKECSLTKAVATLLDYVGFSNYIFYVTSQKDSIGAFDTIIPYFFVNESMTVAEALQALSVATQSAMFFDEKNNFVVMPRKHFGTDPVYLLRSVAVDGRRPNIEDITSFSLDTMSDIAIKFTHRDIAREHLMDLKHRIRDSNASSTLGESSNTVGYKVSSLWDASKLENPTLAVGMLRVALSAEPPRYDTTAPDGVANGSFDIGMWAEFFGNFEGMVMMNGEIIRYDAKQYNINGRNVWVTSQNHLDELTGRSPFRRADGTGQLIYPTGLLRIYTDFSNDGNGNLVLMSHGRGMFNTTITYHPAEPIEWTNGKTYKHQDVGLDTVFGVVGSENYNYVTTPISQELSYGTIATNYIFNPMHSKNSPVALNPITIDPVNVNVFDTERRIMRSSALTFSGEQNSTANDTFLKIKQLPGNGYNMFGMRMGIVGNLDGTDEQSPFGSTVLGEYKLASDSAEDSNKTILGAGGGLLFGTSRFNPRSSSDRGYYLEITALNSSYELSEDNSVREVIFSNVNFYKLLGGTAKGGTGLPPASLGYIPVKLFSTFTDIRVTSGSQLARDRLMTDVNLVYDIAVEKKKVSTVSGSVSIFYIYINDVLIGVVEDDSSEIPPEYENTEIGFFVRGQATIQVENLWAIGTDAFNLDHVTVDKNVNDRPRSFRIYSPSAMWSTVALSGGPQNKWRYWEEFGSTARECRYINMKYDLFPVLKAKIAKTAIFDKAFSTTHFVTTPYDGNMFIASQADRPIRLAEDANLVVHGLTLADNEEQTITINDFLTGNYDGASRLENYNSGIRLRNQLLANRVNSSIDKIEFESMYIQNRDHAIKLLNWLSGFVGTERSTLSITAFGIPHVQIGDIVGIEHHIPDSDGISNLGEYEPDSELYLSKMVEFASNGSRFIVRNIDVARDLEGPIYNVSLVELPSKEIWNAGDF